VCASFDLDCAERLAHAFERLIARHPLKFGLLWDNLCIHLQADALAPSGIAVADPASGNRFFDVVHAVVAVLAKHPAIDGVALRPLLFHSSAFGCTRSLCPWMDAGWSTTGE